MPDAFIVTGARSPIGKFMGGLMEVPAPRLGALAIAEVLKRGKVASDLVDEVIEVTGTRELCPLRSPERTASRQSEAL